MTSYSTFKDLITFVHTLLRVSVLKVKHLILLMFSFEKKKCDSVGPCLCMFVCIFVCLPAGMGIHWYTAYGRTYIQTGM